MIGIGSGLGRVGVGARLTLPLAPTILSVADRGNGTCGDRGRDHPSLKMSLGGGGRWTSTRRWARRGLSEQLLDHLLESKLVGFWAALIVFF